jgi:hypothetical protein
LRIKKKTILTRFLFRFHSQRVHYNYKEDTYIVVWSFANPDFDLYGQVLKSDGTKLGSPLVLLATYYDDHGSTLALDYHTGNYLLATEYQPNTSFVAMTTLNANGTQLTNWRLLGGGSLNNPRNISRPDVAFNYLKNEFGMVLEYDQGVEHDIVSLRVSTTGEPDHMNPHNVAEYNDEDPEGVHQSEPSISAAPTGYLVAYETVAANVGLIEARTLDNDTVPYSRRTNVTTSMTNGRNPQLHYNRVWLNGLAAETISADGRKSDIDFIVLDRDLNPVDRITAPGQHTDDQPVLTYNSVDLNWLLAFSSHPGARVPRNVAASRAEAERRRRSSTLKRSAPQFFVLDDASRLGFTQKKRGESVVARRALSKREELRAGYTGETSNLTVTLVCGISK